jgi:phosphatidylserine/phosphatidylglycerophosphate/cardiolipin synthase-like enzyme
MLDDLQWARRLLGDEGPLMVLNALRATGALHCTPPVIRPEVLAGVLASWASISDPQVAVTRPPWLASMLPEAHTTRDVLTYLFAAATKQVRVCSPYLDREGVGLLVAPVREAAGRGVQVMVATHHLDDPQSPNARAVGVLRAEVPTVVGIHLPSLVHTGDGGEALMVHAKVVIVDDHTALVGSANLTKAGLTGNIEVGVVVRGAAVRHVHHVWEAVVSVASRR